MTIEELIDSPPEVLEKMSDQQLLEHFSKYLNVTRPDRAPKPIRSSSIKESDRIYIPPEKQKMFDLLRQQGIDVDYRKFKKRPA